MLDEQLRLNDLPAPGILFGRGLRLLQDPESERHAIFLGSVALFEWTEDGRATRRLVVAQLVNAKLATRVDVAQVFGLHVNTVSRIAQHVAAEEVSASVGRKRGPHGPRKVTPGVVAQLRQAVAAALPERAAQRQLEQRLKIRLSQPQVHRVMHRLKQELAEQPALELVPVAADEERAAAVAEASVPESAASASRPESNQLEHAPVESTALTLAPGQSIPSRYLGLTLFYPALQVVGLLELAAQVYALGGIVRFGVQQVFTELFCLALLQEPSVERVKHVLRSDLGAVMGSGQAACVKTLRRKLDELNAQRQAVQLVPQLHRNRGRFHSALSKPEVPNPPVKAATVELKRLRTVAQKLRAALGRAVVQDTDKRTDIADDQAETASELTLTADRPSAKIRRAQQVPPATRVG